MHAFMQAHIFDRVVEELMLSRGGCIGFYQARFAMSLQQGSPA